MDARLSKMNRPHTNRVERGSETMAKDKDAKDATTNAATSATTAATTAATTGASSAQAAAAAKAKEAKLDETVPGGRYINARGAVVNGAGETLEKAPEPAEEPPAEQ